MLSKGMTWLLTSDLIAPGERHKGVFKTGDAEHSKEGTGAVL